MSIRKATIDDLGQLLALSKWMHMESPKLSRLSYSAERAEQVMRVMLNDTDPRFAVFVAERKDGFIVGFIAGFADSHMTSSDIVAHVSVFFMLPDSRASIDAERLVCVMRAWGEIKGAKWLQADESAGIGSVEAVKTYKEMGFSQSTIGLEVCYGP